MNCYKYFRARKHMGHLGTLLHEMVTDPDDGSIELELDDTIQLLKTRGVLV